MDNEHEHEHAEPAIFDSYGRFRICCGHPVQWLEFDGDQQALIGRLQPGEAVFAVEVKVNFMSGAMLP